MTTAEKRLWYLLRGNRFEGLAFKRQTPVGPFIVDFISHERRLIIEVDGGQHSGNKNDDRRSRWLQSKGYRVLRFWNVDVLANQNAVLEIISEAIMR